METLTVENIKAEQKMKRSLAKQLREVVRRNENGRGGELLVNGKRVYQVRYRDGGVEARILCSGAWEWVKEWRVGA
jgi:hypothetical protein